MPEIGEVARIVHFLRTHLRNRKIASVIAPDDPIVFGKAGCTAAEFAVAMTGKTVVDAKQQGKYFWLEMSAPPHALMHFGMTGWIHLSNTHTGYYQPKKEAGGEKKWPPDYAKFRLVMEGTPECEVVFVDPRRLGRVRLVDVPAEKMRRVKPLSDNGPDPVIDRETVTKKWLGERLRKKRVPVKAWFLDQGNLSGVGNWVADELLFQARIHPEQYSNSFSEAEVGRLHDALMLVCQTACDTLAIADDFPENWIMKHRKAGKLPTGEKITLLKVGGRTSAVVPSLQKKTGAVAGDVDVKAEKGKAADKAPKSTGTTKKRKANEVDEPVKMEEEAKERKVDTTKRRSSRKA